MIPAFNQKGVLPPGVHKSTWEEFVERFGITPHRLRLIGMMLELIRHLKIVQCKTLFIDGSFVTDKHTPNDYDACWDPSGVKIEIIDKILLNCDEDGKNAMAVKYGGDIRPSSFSPLETNDTYLAFFQVDRDGDAKGIIQLSLEDIVL